MATKIIQCQLLIWVLSPLKSFQTRFACCAIRFTFQAATFAQTHKSEPLAKETRAVRWQQSKVTELERRLEFSVISFLGAALVDGLVSISVLVIKSDDFIDCFSAVFTRITSFTVRHAAVIKNLFFIFYFVNRIGLQSTPTPFFALKHDEFCYKLYKRAQKSLQIIDSWYETINKWKHSRACFYKLDKFHSDRFH